MLGLLLFEWYLLFPTLFVYVCVCVCVLACVCVCVCVHACDCVCVCTHMLCDCVHVRGVTELGLLRFTLDLFFHVLYGCVCVCVCV